MGLEPKVTMIWCSLFVHRLLDEDVELSLSTREDKVFRNNVVQLGINSLSAESRTNPGYTVEKQSLEQFEISDERSTEEISAMLKNQGLEVIWKDWEHFK